MIVYRWIPGLQGFEPCEVPDNWKVTCFETDMRRRVNCAGCGERMPYGRTFTSRTLRNENGEGYAVCGRCRDYELKGENR